MKRILNLTALSILLSCTAAMAYRPAIEAPREVVIEGHIDGVSAGTVPTIIVDSNRIYLSQDTIIKSSRGFLRPSELKMGMKVTVFGVVAKGGVMARLIQAETR